MILYLFGVSNVDYLYLLLLQSEKNLIIQYSKNESS
jgi:hypothetical protein